MVFSYYFFAYSVFFVFFFIISPRFGYDCWVFGVTCSLLRVVSISYIFDARIFLNGASSVLKYFFSNSRFYFHLRWSGAFFAPLPFPELPEPEIFSNLLVLGVISVSIFGVSIFLRIRKHSFLLVALKRVFRVVTSFLRVALFGQSYLIELRYAIADLSSIYYFKFKILVLTVFSRLLFLWGVGFYLHSLGVVFYGLSWAAYIVAPVMSFVVDLLGLVLMAGSYELLMIGGEMPDFMETGSIKNGVYSMKKAAQSLIPRSTGGSNVSVRPRPIYPSGSGEPAFLGRRGYSSYFEKLMRTSRFTHAQGVYTLSALRAIDSPMSFRFREAFDVFIGPHFRPDRDFNTLNDYSRFLDSQIRLIHAVSPSGKSTDLGLQGFHARDRDNAILSVLLGDKDVKLSNYILVVEERNPPLITDDELKTDAIYKVGSYSVWDKKGECYVDLKQRFANSFLTLEDIGKLIDKALQFSTTTIGGSSLPAEGTSGSGPVVAFFNDLSEVYNINLSRPLNVPMGQKEDEILKFLEKILMPTANSISIAYREACVSALLAGGWGAHIGPVEPGMANILASIRGGLRLSPGVNSGYADCSAYLFDPQTGGVHKKFLVELKNRGFINIRLMFQSPDYARAIFAYLDGQLPSNGFNDPRLRPVSIMEPWSYKAFKVSNSDVSFDEDKYKDHLDEVCSKVKEEGYTGFMVLVTGYNPTFPATVRAPGFYMLSESPSGMHGNRLAFVEQTKGELTPMVVSTLPSTEVNPITDSDLKQLNTAAKRAYEIQAEVFAKHGLTFEVAVTGVAVPRGDYIEPKQLVPPTVEIEEID